MVKLLASYNKDVDAVVLKNAPQNAKYTSHEVQTELLSLYARKVQHSIREEIGSSKSFWHFVVLWIQEPMPMIYQRYAPW